MKSYFDQNLELLRQHNPSLANRVVSEPIPENIVLDNSKDGKIVPVYNNVSLHSTYFPEKEAVDSVQAFNPIPNSQIVVFGLGYGYHLDAILEKVNGDILVMEPRMSVFRIFMEYKDLSEYLPRTSFIVDEPPSRILARNDTSNWDLFVHQPSANISSAYFQRLNSSIRVMDVLEKQALKIMVVNPIYGGSLPTAHFCKKALENLGHMVESVDCENFKDSFQSIRQVTSNGKNQQALNQNFLNLMGEVIMAQAVDFRPDLVLVMAQAPMSPSIFERFKQMKTPLAFWFVEDFRTMPYWKEVANQYNYFFTIQRGECFEALEKVGMKNYYYLPQAACPEVHKKVELDQDEEEEFSAPVSFMGEGYHNRRQAFRRLLDFDLKIWGTGWVQDKHYHPYIQNKGERVGTEDCVKIYNAGKVNINLHSSTFHDGVNPNGDFVNPRTFEIAACQSFQLVDERSELADCFNAGEEIVTFKTLEEMRQKTAYYLEHDDERKAIARKGYERVVREHTMEHRMKEMLLHIYSEREEELQVRIELRKTEIGMALEQAAGDDELVEFLKPFEGQKDFSFQTVLDSVSKGNGSLNEQELLFLMVDQIIPKNKN